MYYWGKPQFYGVRAAASNVGQSEGNYTAAQFQADFPQFFNADGDPLLPSSVLDMLIGRANACIQPDKWLETWQYAVGLYVAHYATLYLRTYASSSDSPQQAAASGALVGVPSSVKMGDVSVNYDTDALTAGTENWGNLNATQYGQMLASEAKLVGMGGSVII